MLYHVMSAHPGMIRGGRPNPPHAAYQLGDHTPEQLRELIADPHHTVVVGEVMTEAHVAEIEAAALKLKAEAATAAAQAAKGKK